jgi:hypothetical protein
MKREILTLVLPFLDCPAVEVSSGRQQVVLEVVLEVVRWLLEKGCWYQSEESLSPNIDMLET